MSVWRGIYDFSCNAVADEDSFFFAIPAQSHLGTFDHAANHSEHLSAEYASAIQHIDAA